MRFADQRRGSSSSRGYGYKWSKLRKGILTRDAGLCQPCKREGKLTAATEVDHIINKAIGGTDDDDNLQSICEPCHKDKTQQEAAKAAGYELKLGKACDIDGWPIDTRHHWNR